MTGRRPDRSQVWNFIDANPLSAAATPGHFRDNGYLALGLGKTFHEAGGAWNAEGGSASGRIDLTASTLTRRLERMFGSQAAFSVLGRKAGAFQDLTVKIDSPNLKLSAAGQADLGKRLSYGGFQGVVQG